ncbi:MAG TPA: VCBS repeat-containing protein [Chthoniobacterales bacterium]|jgi:hypothetical protein
MFSLINRLVFSLALLSLGVTCGRSAPLFNSAPFISVGSSPSGVALGDFNQDGQIDFAVSNQVLLGTVSVFFGRGSSFQPAGVFATGGKFCVALTSGDFDGDGKPDLAVVNTCINGECRNGSVTVELNQGDGTFAATATYDTGVSPEAIAAGDLNHDGKIDLVVTNGSTNSVSIFLGNGDSTFTPGMAVKLRNRAEPSGITLADMNGDGTLDLVVAENVASQVAISLGNGDGTFKPAHAFDVGGLASAVAVGDFDGDGKMDVAATVYAADDGQGGNVAVLLGNGNGGLGAATLYPIGAMPSAIIARDSDGDGKLDLAAISKDGNNLATLKGNGDGTFQAGVSYTVGAQPSAFAEGAFGNSRALLVADFAGGTVTLLRESKSGRLSASGSFTTDAGPTHVVLDDFNHDGVTDAAVANGIGETVSVLLGQPDGTFAAASDYAVGDAPNRIASGDFNGDGNSDLVVANTGEEDVSLLFGNGDGTFQSKRPVGFPGPTITVAAADFNHDGKLDLAVGTSNTSDAVSISLGNGDGTFHNPSPISAGQNPNGIAIADFNGDGNLDIAVADFEGNFVTVALGDGDGHFQTPTTYPLDGEQSLDIAVADVNGDGIPDLIIANVLTDSISQLLGTGTGTFVNGDDISLPAEPLALLAADLNGDGSPDLAISENNIGLEVRLNDGQGNFNAIVDSTAGSPFGLALGRFGSRQQPGLAVVTGGGAGAVGSLSLLLQKGR